VLAVLAFAAWLESRDPTAYYLTLQEDGSVEWISFWAFLLAALANAAAIRRAGEGASWFHAALALFCFFVAMEEISWGQRVLGFRPPTYFLEHNFQQEANIHNVVDTGLRKLALSAVIAGYGLVLPALAALAPSARWLRRLGVAAPPAALAPAFAATLVTYLAYPWDFTGEIVELMLGGGLLAGAVLGAPRAGGRARPVTAVAVWSLLALALGLGSAELSRGRTSADPAALEAARVELDALGADLDAHAEDRSVRRRVHCGVHKRLYSLVSEGGDFVRDGAFAGLVERGLPEARATFLIDPWSTAYWIRFSCEDDEGWRSLFLYSFGPNRLRDSDDWEIRGDDVGVYLLGPPDRDRPTPSPAPAP
jgi:hypothetical protein